MITSMMLMLMFECSVAGERRQPALVNKEKDSACCKPHFLFTNIRMTCVAASLSADRPGTLGAVLIGLNVVSRVVQLSAC
jgi:hypothetical protein